ncbi:alpha/beta hydrolase [Leptospira sp. WS92.C1]
MNSLNILKGMPFLIDYSGLKKSKEARITETSLRLPNSVLLRGKILEAEANSTAPVIYLQHGMSAKGIDDPRIIALGTNLVNRGFKVYLPELPEVKGLLMKSETVLNIRSVFLEIHSLEKRFLSYVSASFSAGMGFVALANPECQKVLSSSLLIGGYFNFGKTFPYILKNYEIESYAVNVMMFNFVHLIRSKTEELQKYFYESALDNGLARKGEDRKGPKILQTLDFPDRTFVKDFIENPEFRIQAAQDLRAQVSDSFIEETSPAFFSSQVIKKCFLLHGNDDPVISSQESRDLRDLLLKNPDSSPVFLETSLLTHGDHLPFYSRIQEILPMAGFWGEFLSTANGKK